MMKIDKAPAPLILRHGAVGKIAGASQAQGRRT